MEFLFSHLSLFLKLIDIYFFKFQSSPSQKQQQPGTKVIRNDSTI